jgi:hypothetical protein
MGPNYGYGRHGYRQPYDPFYPNQAGLGIDVTDGDIVENLGDGLGIDLDTGQVEVDFGGFDFPL